MNPDHAEPLVSSTLAEVRTLHRSGQLLAAMRACQALLQVQGDAPEIHYRLGMIAVQIGNPQLGASHFKTALASASAPGNYWLAYLDALLLCARHAEAQSALQKARDLPADLLDAFAARIAMPVAQTRPAAPAPVAPDPALWVRMLGLFAEARYEEALASAREMSARYPDFGMGWKFLALVLKQSGQIQEAIAALQCAVKRVPTDTEALNQLGQLLWESGAHSAAQDCYRRALAARPEAFEGYYNLANSFLDLGQSTQAESPLRVLLTLRPGFAEGYNSLGLCLRNLGCMQDSARYYRLALAINPELAEAHNNLGITLSEQGRVDEAHDSYQRALAIRPDYVEALNNLGNLLRERGLRQEAETHLLCALALRPRFAQARNNLGNVQREAGRLAEAEASYRLALAQQPDYAEAQGNLGAVLMDLGRLDEGRACLEQALTLAPGDADALASALLYLPYQAADPRFCQLEPVYAARAALPLVTRIKLDFAMGRALETLGDEDRAFTAYREGNLLHFQQYPYDETQDLQFMENTQSFYSAALLGQFASIEAPVDTRVPIFIVGMPRSGTSLIEQVLASHAALYGAGELTLLGEVARQADQRLRQGGARPEVLADLRQLGRNYLDQVWALAPGSSHITDKLPGNFYHLGLIHLMLPQARIVHVERDPMDNCFSCFALLFSTGHEYSYDLGALGRQYLRYRALMRHWQQVLPPGRVLDVRYEDTVADLEREARRLLAYIGLPWDAACLDFHRTRRTVSTASVMQVRQPIYTRSLARWKRFESHLGPLYEILYAS